MTDSQRQAELGQAHPHKTSDKCHCSSTAKAKATASSNIDMLAEAKRLLGLGIAVIPPKMDGSKAPLMSWSKYQNQLPTEDELERWYASNNTGLGVICGTISSNLECLDFDNQDAWQQYQQLAKVVGLGDLLARVMQGYSEYSPNGFHLFYRIDSTVPGNTKLACSADGKKVLVETRGEGGFAIIAPSHGKAHPSGQSYQRHAGDWSTIATLPLDEHSALHELARSIDQRTRPLYQPSQDSGLLPTKGDRPGDQYNASTTWLDILTPHGWVAVSTRDEVTHWRRSGKEQGTSATTNFGGSDYLYVFSTSTPFDTARTYDRFGAYAVLEHGGDFVAAAKALMVQGYGDPAWVAHSSPEDAAWPPIIPLKAELPAVEPFDITLLPDPLSDWVQDIAERLQCAVDFVAVAVMVAVASLVGRKVVILPKQHDNWQVTCNLWGVLIGLPSSMKTPAMDEALKPLHALRSIAEIAHEAAVIEHQIDSQIQQHQSKKHDDALKKAVSSGTEHEIATAKQAAIELASQQTDTPTEKRYIVNDSTVEKLGELLNENPNGLLLHRDELTGWLNTLDREDRSSDRSFYLEAFNGNGNFTYDRIGRGTVKIKNVTLSLVGGIQPAKLQRYVWHAVNSGDQDDGLMQRLQLAVYPDMQQWQHIDRPPDKQAADQACKVFQRLDTIPFADEPAMVHFDTTGQPIFNDWLCDWEPKLRAPDMHPALQSHFTKYRSLLPSLALIINEVEQGHALPVTASSAHKAIRWISYLQSHALRIYGGAIDPAVTHALTIKARYAKLPTLFTVGDIQRKGWTGLIDTPTIKRAVDVLCECHYLRSAHYTSPQQGGRPSIRSQWHPDMMAKNSAQS